jgi:hypothetical protein
MDRYFRTREDELVSVVAAESEPAVRSAHASLLPYGLSRGHHGRAQVRLHHHAPRMSDSGDAYSRRRHAYAHRE